MLNSPHTDATTTSTSSIMVSAPSEGTMLRLPDVQVIRTRSQGNRSDGISLMDRKPD